MTNSFLRSVARLKTSSIKFWNAITTSQHPAQNLFWVIIALSVWSLFMAFPTPPELGLRGQQAVALLVTVSILFATEAISLPAIGLLIPVYQVVVSGLTPELVTGWMMSNALLFLMGTLMLVAAISSRGLDKLIALFILTNVGTSVYSVIFGIVLVSSLLAGFMSDAAAALMLAPVLGIINIVRDSVTEKIPNLTKMLIFAVGFGSIIGSPYTPAGGARNIIMMDYMQQLAGVQISFFDWVVFMLPYTVIMIILLTLLLPWVFPPETINLKKAIRSLRVEVRERPIGVKQMTILGVFSITLVLWMTVGTLFGIGIIAVGAAAFLLAVGAVEWRHYQNDVDWGVLMIYIGAISLGGYTAETGAASWIAGSFLEFVSNLGIESGSLLVILTSLLTTALTSTMSAGATASVLGPIVLKIGVSAGISPVIMGLATALASSLGFMLIVSTPANAIIFASGHLKTTDFLKIGSWVTLCAFVVFLGLYFLYWPWLL